MPSAHAFASPRARVACALACVAGGFLEISVIQEAVWSLHSVHSVFRVFAASARTCKMATALLAIPADDINCMPPIARGGKRNEREEEWCEGEEEKEKTV